MYNRIINICKCDISMQRWHIQQWNINVKIIFNVKMRYECKDVMWMQNDKIGDRI